MAEPTSTLATFFAGMAAATLAVFGVAYHTLLFAGIGSLFGLVLVRSNKVQRSVQRSPEWWRRLFFMAVTLRMVLGTTTLSALMGAVIGDALGAIFTAGLPLKPDAIDKITRALAAVCAAGATPVVAACISSVVKRIDGLGGKEGADHA